MNRRCIDCGQLTTRLTRCALHEKMYQAARNHRRKNLYGGDWQTTSKQARMMEPWCHCGGCPSCKTAPAGLGCVSMDLTLDHEHRRVECRACNAGHRHNPGEA